MNLWEDGDNRRLNFVGVLSFRPMFDLSSPLDFEIIGLSHRIDGKIHFDFLF